VLGITFKENCPDIRNSRVIDVINELKEFGCFVDVYDPWADPKEVKREYNIELITNNESRITSYDAVILAVAHKEFKEIEKTIYESRITNHESRTIIYDIKGFFDKSLVDGRL